MNQLGHLFFFFFLPRSTWKLLTNKIYLVTCLGACMELIIVSGFIVFLPKYLETQFNLSKSMASMFTGGIAIPGACIGIFFGGYILKRLQLRPKGAVQLVIFFNILCLSCYALLFFFGCDNIKMAGTTMPYYNTKYVFYIYFDVTSKSLSEAFIFESTNPQYDKRLFIDVPVQYMKTTSSEHVAYTNCFCFDIQNNICTQHVLSL